MSGLLDYWIENEFLTQSVDTNNAIFSAILKEEEYTYKLSNIRFIPNDKNAEICNELIYSFNKKLFCIEFAKSYFEEKFKSLSEDINYKKENNTEDKFVFFSSRISNHGVYINKNKISYAQTVIDFLNGIKDKSINTMNECQKVNYVFNESDFFQKNNKNSDKNENDNENDNNENRSLKEQINKEEILDYEDKIGEKINSLRLTFEHELYNINENFKEQIKKNNTVVDKKIKELENVIAKYKELIDSISEIPVYNKVESNVKYFEKKRPKNIINTIISYLYYSENLYYDVITIKQFYASLCTNQITILSGKPGTGKTSLVQGFCKATGIKNKIISVQPNWNDNQDLIGFYNPVEKVYVSSPLIDFIVEANLNKGLLYVVCLDEMNLSQTEYYLSEFLSKLETSDRTIELYSEDVFINNYRNTLDILKYIISKYGKDDKKRITDPEKIIKLNVDSFDNIDFETFKLFNKEKEKLINYQTYKNKITIPKNFKIVGTINKDEYTKNLSPKVIDRSSIMEIKQANAEDVKKTIGSLVQKTPLRLSSSCFDLNRKSLFDEELNKILNKQKKLFKDTLDIELNNRFDKHALELYQSDIFNENNEFLDIIKLMKIVPKINMYVDSDEQSKFFNTTDELFSSNMPESYSIYKKMKEYCKNHDVFTFWR